MPPLRNRREDIPVLAEHFVRKHQQRTGKRIERIEEGVHEKLAAYEWPGNVRELENTIERAVVLSTNGAISAPSISVLGVATGQSSALPVAEAAHEHRVDRTGNDPPRARQRRRRQEGRGGFDGHQPARAELLPREIQVPITGRVSDYAPRNGGATRAAVFPRIWRCSPRHRLCLRHGHETAACLDRAFGARVVGARLGATVRYALRVVAAAVLLLRARNGPGTTAGDPRRHQLMTEPAQFD